MAAAASEAASLAFAETAAASELVSRAVELVEERSLVRRLEGGGSWLIVYVWCVYGSRGRIAPW